MPALVRSAALAGIDAVPVDVEVELLQGIPSFTVVGLTDKAIQEARERMTAALTNTGYTPPRRKTIVSLAPASLKKEGSLYDLPITLGFLLASKQLKIKPGQLSKSWFVGELGLDGSVRSVRGVLPIVLAAAKAGMKEVYIPADNADEAAAVADQILVYSVSSLATLLEHLEEGEKHHALASVTVRDMSTDTPPIEVDFADIRGQDHAKRAMIIAAAAHSNVLLIGPPGTGKTLLARALAGILPPLRREESHVVTSLYSVAGLLPAGHGLITHRPFRSPHHGASSVALVGGGSVPRPGEVSLAHHGVLFLDELPEFPRTTLDQLRQPIEDGVVTISRAAHTMKFPARSMVVGAMNPCPCGFAGSTRKECRCSPPEVYRYQKRVSGPLLDRFDLHVLVSDVSISDLLTTGKPSTGSKEIAQHVSTARARQYARQGKANAALSGKEAKTYAQLEPATERLLLQAAEKFRLSARSLHRLLKVALTIADLEAQNSITTQHLAEALHYREQVRQALPNFV